jgi:hypothetical protein
MNTLTLLRSLSLVALLLLAAGTARAQSVAIGGGIALPGSEIASLPEDVREAGWTELRRRAEGGYFIEARGRIGGGMALVGAVSYNRFRDAVSEYRDGSGRSVTLISSQAIVPVSVGLESRFGDGIIAPYGTLEGTLSYFYRAFESTQRDVPVPFRIESTGETRFGAAVAVGSSLDLSIVRFDAFARLHLVNIFGAESTTEPTMYYLQLGVNGNFGL